ncbi:MAG: hypothetical protein ACPG5L_11615 [Vibrio gallaecicus]
MDIEIYMPCNPVWFCETLEVLFAVLFFVGALFFIRIVWKEHQRIYGKAKRSSTSARKHASISKSTSKHKPVSKRKPTSNKNDLNEK